MRINTINTYTCEVCGTTYEDEKAAKMCEDSPISENYNKYIGKILLVPSQVLLSTETPNGIDVNSKVLWNVIRVDQNTIKPLAPAIMRNALYNINQYGHRVVYKGTSAYPGATLFDSLLKFCHEVPSDMHEEIIKKIVDIYANRDKIGSPAGAELYACERAETLTRDVASKMNVVINNMDFDQFPLEGLGNVSSKLING